MSAIQLQADMWTQFEGDQVDCLLIRRPRLDYRRRISDHWVKLDEPIERVLVGDNYLNEFAVQIYFADYVGILWQKNDPIWLRMLGRWECRGRVMSVTGKRMALLCPVCAENGLPKKVYTLATQQKMLMGPGKPGFAKR